MKKNFYRMTVMMFVAVIIVTIMIAIDAYKLRHLSKNEVGQQVTTESLGVVIEDTQGPELFAGVKYEQPEVISKGLALKMVALSKEDKASIKVRDREIEYEDTSREDWFDKYFNVGIVEGWLVPEGDHLNPLDPLTYGEAKSIADAFAINLEETALKLEDKVLDQAISYVDWMVIFEVIQALVDIEEQPQIATLYIFATPTISSSLDNWEMATDKGKYYFEGIAMDGCINKEITAMVRGREVLYIQDIIQETPILTNAYILDLDMSLKIAEVFMGGVTRNIPIDDTLKSDSQKAFIGDIQLIDNKLAAVTPKMVTTHGVVKKINAVEIEIEDIGKIPIAEDAKFYNLTGELSFTEYTAIIVGYDTATLILDQDQVVAIMIMEKIQLGPIRVIIKDSNFKALIHSQVTLTCAEPYRMVTGRIEQEMVAGETLDLEKLNFKVGDRAILIPEKEGRIKITSINRGYSGGYFNPEYRGIIEVEKVDTGYMIINEVDFEEYLYSVVPSEMPASYGLEAAKVQAICARSYAYAQMKANRYCNYGAHVDDSVTCQVYNNVPESAQSMKAVKDTKGLLLSFEGNVISANFFSTSWGMTANSGDVWADYASKEFPTTSSPYLVTTYQNDEGSVTADLTNEEAFGALIIKNDLLSFDAEFPWYRWSTTLSKAQIEAVINKTIGTRYNAQPKLIKTLDANNIFKSRPVQDIGELLDLWVYSRGDSGIITEMIIKGTKGVYKIATEYNIRALIAPTNYIEGETITILKNDGKTSGDMSLMPSAYYVMDKTYNDKSDLTRVTFHGGGYGHGVGMSQNGVKAMVDQGYEYEAILSHYYPGTALITTE